MEELAETEKIILEIVREYLDKNRQFNLGDIIPFISSRLRATQLNLNYRGIKGILKSLLDKKFLIEGSKLSHRDILENEKRKVIYEYILNHPGTYFNKIVSDLDFSNHVVVWHLSMLLKFNFIKKTIIEGHETYSDLKISDIKTHFHYVVSKKKSKLIINYLERNYLGVTKTELASKLKIHINTISKFLEKLQELNIIKTEIIDKKRLYFLKSKM